MVSLITYTASSADAFIRFFTTYSIEKHKELDPKTALISWDIWHWLSSELINNDSCQFIVFCQPHIYELPELAGTSLVLSNKAFVDRGTCQEVNEFERHRKVFRTCRDNLSFYSPPKAEYCFPFGAVGIVGDTIVYFSFFLSHEAAFQGLSWCGSCFTSWNCVWMKLAALFCILQTFGHLAY